MAFLDYIFGTPTKRVEKDLFTPGQNQFLDRVTNQLETIVPMGLENFGQYLTSDKSPSIATLSIKEQYSAIQ